jgi:hypothetical protein
VKVYLDDERTEPQGWTRVYWPDEAIELLQTGQVTELSLDHDLGDDTRGTGYDVLLWLEQAVVNNGFTPPQRIVIHSANASAWTKMSQAIDSIARLASK